MIPTLSTMFSFLGVSAYCEDDKQEARKWRRA